MIDDGLDIRENFVTVDNSVFRINVNFNSHMVELKPWYIGNDCIAPDRFVNINDVFNDLTKNCDFLIIFVRDRNVFTLTDKCNN